MLRDHSQPCEHEDIAEDVGDGQWMCIGQDCPGGRVVETVKVDWCSTHNDRYPVREPCCTGWFPNPRKCVRTKVLIVKEGSDE